MACIRVPGPWVLVPARAASAKYLLSCPGGRSIVGGLDAQASSRDVRVSFDGQARRAGRPRRDDDALRALPCGLDCEAAAGVPAAARLRPDCRVGEAVRRSRRASTPAGPSLEYRSRIVIIGPGQVEFAKVACQPGEQLVGSWHAIAFRVKKPPQLGSGSLVDVTRRSVGKQVVATASATDGLSIDVHAVVQVGAECAP